MADYEGLLPQVHNDPKQIFMIFGTDYFEPDDALDFETLTVHLDTIYQLIGKIDQLLPNHPRVDEQFVLLTFKALSLNFLLGIHSRALTEGISGDDDVAKRSLIDKLEETLKRNGAEILFDGDILAIDMWAKEEFLSKVLDGVPQDMDFDAPYSEFLLELIASLSDYLKVSLGSLSRDDDEFAALIEEYLDRISDLLGLALATEKLDTKYKTEWLKDQVYLFKVASDDKDFSSETVNMLTRRFKFIENNLNVFTQKHQESILTAAAQYADPAYQTLMGGDDDAFNNAYYIYETATRLLNA